MVFVFFLPYKNAKMLNTKYNAQERSIMQLQWMGEYREIVEKLIHYCNVYASVYKKECITKSGVTFSFSQLFRQRILHLGLNGVAQRTSTIDRVKADFG